MRSRLVAVLPLFGLLVAGCTGSDGGDAGEAPVAVIAMHNRMYDPASVTVAHGTTLRFEAHDMPHTAQTTDQRFATGDIPAGEHRDIADLPAGTYVFRCKYHSSMQLTATVTA